MPADPPVVPTSTPTSTPVFASEADALAAAEAAYKAYLKVSDQILMDSGKNPERLLAVATKSVLEEESEGFSQAAAKHWRSTGGTTVTGVKTESYSPTAKFGQPVITVYACVDVSKVGFLDSRGRSVVAPDRPDVTPFETSFQSSSAGSSELILSKEDLWLGADFCSD